MLNSLKRLATIDLRSLAAFRVGLGVLLICDLFNRGLYIFAHYTDKGLLPRGVYLTNFANKYFWSFHHISGLLWFQALLFFFAFFLAVMLVLGYRTRLVTILSWLLLVSIQNRNYMILQGGDVLFRLLLFWAMFLPLGAKYSIDNALANTNIKVNSKIKQITSVAALVIPLQIAMLYFFAAIFKYNDIWLDGLAVRDALLLDHFTSSLGNYLLNFPALTTALTYFTLVVEFCAVFLIFSPFKTYFFRFIAFILFFILHLGLFFTLELGLFPWICITGLLCLLPPFFWDFLGKRFLPQKSITIFFDDSCTFCQKGCLLLKEFLIAKVDIKAAQQNPEIYKKMQENNSWVIKDQNNNLYYQYSAWIILIKNSFFFWLTFIFKLSLSKIIGSRIYKYVSNNRSKAAIITRIFNKPEVIKLHNHKFISSILVLLITFCLAWNIVKATDSTHKLPNIFKFIAHTIRLDQKWNMFSKPSIYDGWYIIKGKLKNNKVVDVYNETIDPPSWQRPKNLADTYPSQRWRKYLGNLHTKRHRNHRLHYSRYLCRKWNAKAFKDEDKLKELTIYFILEKTVDHKKTKPRELKIWDHKCF